MIAPSQDQGEADAVGEVEFWRDFPLDLRCDCETGHVAGCVWTDLRARLAAHDASVVAAARADADARLAEVLRERDAHDLPTTCSPSSLAASSSPASSGTSAEGAEL